VYVCVCMCVCVCVCVCVYVSPMQKTSVQYVSSRKKSGVAPLEEMYGVI